jgi:hypothetical protein
LAALSAVLLCGAMPQALAEDTVTDYAGDWVAFAHAIDTAYPFFDLKGNRADWESLKPALAKRAADCPDDAAFLLIVVDAFKVLHDSHMWFRETRVEPPARPKEYTPGIAFMPASDGRVLVMAAYGDYQHALKPGTIVATINGEGARAYLDKRSDTAWATSMSSSPQRTRLYEYRIPLKSPQDTRHTLTYQDDVEAKTLEVACTHEARGWPHTYNLPNDLARVGRSIFCARLPSGVGYLYLRRVDASIVPGIQAARERFPKTKGWIVDLRGNGGGGYDRTLVQALAGLPGAMAVLIDAGCASAGETLARDMRREATARLFGTPTAGSSSSKRGWSFPSGVATVTLSTRSRWRNDGQPIEFNGIQPDEFVEPVPEDVLAGKNTSILRAEAWLLTQAPAQDLIEEPIGPISQQ